MLAPWIDRYDPKVANSLALWRPQGALVGAGAWNSIPLIAELLTPPKFLILRLVEATIKDRPYDIAHRICMEAHRYPDLTIIAHGLNENQSPESVSWELAFIEACHLQGVPTICCNYAVGNDPPPGWQRVAEASDLVGAHLYILWDSKTQSYVDNIYTAFRYRQWKGWPRHKHLATECGIDHFGHYEGAEKPGWRELGLPAEEVYQRLTSVVMEWRRDGLIGGVYFTLATQNPEWSPYYPEPDWLQRWRGLPPLVLPLHTSTESPPAPGKEENMPRIEEIQERVLDIQRTLHAGKEAKSWTEAGSKIDQAFYIAGDVYNMLEQLKQGK
jgi:hypothetical protein